jgi:hypothetical protein
MLARMTATRTPHDREQLESMIAIVLHRVPILRAELEELRGDMPHGAALYCSSTLDRVCWTAKLLQEILRRDGLEARSPPR